MNPGGETERALNRDLGKMSRPAEQRQPLFASPVRLSGAVGNNRENQSDDVKAVQRSLGGLDLSSESKLYEPSGILDRETLDTLQLFQQASDLRVDGYMNPGGETETAMNAALNRLNAPSPTEEDNDHEDEDEKEEEGEVNEDENEPDCTDQEQALEDAEEELRLAQEALDEAIANLEELKKELEASDKGKEKDCSQLIIMLENTKIEHIKAQEAFEKAQEKAIQAKNTLDPVSNATEAAAKKLALQVVVIILPWGKLLKISKIVRNPVSIVTDVANAMREFENIYADYQNLSAVSQAAYEEQKQAAQVLAEKQRELMQAEKDVNSCQNKEK